MAKRALQAKKWSRSGNDALLEYFSGTPPAEKKKRTCLQNSDRKRLPPSPYRSGTVPFQIDEIGNIHILLVTPRKGGRWILPKGNIARGLDSFHSALKETREEAGVLGEDRKILLGIQENSNHQFIEFYPLEITQILPEWEESKVRSRLFFPLEEARRELGKAEGSAVLDLLCRYIRERENEK